LIAMAVLAIAVVWGLSRVALGLANDQTAIMVNVGWAIYDLVILSVVLDAVTYQPADEGSAPIAQAGGAAVRGRAGAGSA